LDLITFLDIIGTIAFALSGYILAARAKLDLLGISILSYITAFGGGVIRDILIDRTPFIFTETYPILIVFITVITAYLLKLHNYKKLSNNYIFKISDSIGLTVFAYTGASLGILSGFNFAGVVFLALLTSIGGGIISSMMISRIPHVLTNEFYGTISIIVGVLVWTFHFIGVSQNISVFFILLFGFVLRMLALKYKWYIPRVV